MIEGGHYINYRGATVDCSSFAAAGYASLGDKTRGAYNVLLDLITAFSPSNAVSSGTAVHYTLLYEGDLTLNAGGQGTVDDLARAGLDVTDIEPLTVPALIDSLVGTST